jgi:hypothetical protein
MAIGDVELRITTRRPERALEVILAAVPRELHGLLTISSCPRRIGRYEVVYPAK